MRSTPGQGQNPAMDGDAPSLSGGERDASRLLVELGPLERERVYRAIFDSMFEFMAVLTPDGTVVDVNSAALDFAGVPRERVTGLKGWETPWFTHDVLARERLRGAMEQAAAGRFVRYEEEIVGASSARAPIDFSLKPVHGPHGDVMLVIAEGRDITESRVAREALRDSRQRLRLLFDHASIGLALVDTDGHWMQANRALVQMLGCDEPELTYMSLIDATHETQRTELHEQMLAAITGEHDRFGLRTRLRTSHAAPVPVTLEVRLLRDDTGRPTYFFVQVEPDPV